MIIMLGCKGMQQTDDSTACKAKLAELEREREQLLEEEKRAEEAEACEREAAVAREWEVAVEHEHVPQQQHARAEAELVA
jgi:transposase